MITKKDARQIRDALAKAFAMCENSDQRKGVMEVDSAFIEQWSNGKIGFNESLTISEYIEKSKETK